MSMITRIFVIALVVLSLLLSAASITFVSSVDHLNRDNVTLKTQVTGLQAQLSRAESDLQSKVAAKDKELAEKVNAVSALDKTVKELRTQLSDFGGQLSNAKSSLTMSEANVSKLTSALSASEGTKSQALAQVAELRGTLDKIQTQLADVNVAYNDAVNKRDVTEEARRVLAEQLTEIKGQLDKVSGALKDRGVDPTRITSSGVLGGAPPINGVIRETRVISGIPHATISVGTEDGVKTGMEFKILNRETGKFLGTLTIIMVEPNLAIGRLAGPDVAAIAAGAEVRTQL